MSLPIPVDGTEMSQSRYQVINFSNASGKFDGNVCCRLGWNVLDAKEANFDRLNALRSSLIDEDVRNWHENELIDPYDPENFALLPTTRPPHGRIESAPSDQAAKVSGRNTRIDRTYNNGQMFRLNEDVSAFCAAKKFNSNKRIELLCARFNNDIKLKDYRLVPHNEIEIEIPSDLNIFEDMLWVDPIDVQRYQGKVYLKHVYNVITNHCSVINRNMDHNDLLIGDTAPTLNGAIEAFKNIFMPRRPLHPSRSNPDPNDSRCIHLNDVDGTTNFHIIVNIVRASGIPFRNQVQQNHQPSNLATQLIPTCKSFAHEFAELSNDTSLLSSSTVLEHSAVFDSLVSRKSYADVNGGRIEPHLE